MAIWWKQAHPKSLIKVAGDLEWKDYKKDRLKGGIEMLENIKKALAKTLRKMIHFDRLT